MSNNVKIKPVINANDFIGISIIDNQITLKTPLCFRIENDDKLLKKNIILFLKSLSIATKQFEHIKQNDNLIGEIWPIDSYLWLIKDFVDNGFYYKREKTYSINGGKIEWRKTLKKTPIYSNGNIIYKDIITSRMTPTNDEISEIYKFCLSKSIDRIGWLFSYTFNIQIQQYKSIKEMIILVRKELSNTFDDIKRQRFEHMLATLSNINSTGISSKNSTYGIKNYYYVFEKMVNSFFNGIDEKELSKYNPVGTWHLINCEKQSSSELRPDTIVHKTRDGKQYTYILDAKMYKYGGLEHLDKKIDGLPNTSSIQKQITYGDEVKKIEKYVRNAFILPYNKELDRFKYGNDAIMLDKQRNLAYIGFATSSWRKNDDDHTYVFSFLIDFNYLLNNYQKKNDNETLILFDAIEKKLDKKSELFHNIF
ncbi:LlaJI family restriction endonuclease [Coprobacillus sp. AF18-15LB]|nr:LlaJI family restriction endonuclease [Coprobacillus sp. AF18-40]RGT87941.1 LlaJI family restriction endonuclease [Coprobacillus sp. AF18-15LB]